MARKFNRQQRGAAVMITAAVAAAVARRAGVDLREIVESTGLTLEEVMAIGLAAVQGWVVRGAPADEQNRVTPRPS